MGKLVAYLGPPVPVATVVEGGSYSLVRQASEFPDGFGLGWYPADDQPEPVRITSRESIMSAGPQLSVPRRYLSHAIIASIHRTDLPPVEQSMMMPYAAGNLLFSFVGELQRFDAVFRRPLTQQLSDGVFQALRGLSPAELLYANFLDVLADEQGHEAIASALEHLVGIVSEIGMAAEAAASLAIVVADGEGLITLRTSTQGPPPPMYTIVAEADAPVPANGRVVASEPLFPGSWSALDPHSLVIFTGDPQQTGMTNDMPTQPSANDTTF